MHYFQILTARFENIANFVTGTNMTKYYVPIKTLCSNADHGKDCEAEDCVQYIIVGTEHSFEVHPIPTNGASISMKQEGFFKKTKVILVNCIEYRFPLYQF